jgi:hypothetical protein
VPIGVVCLIELSVSVSSLQIACNLSMACLHVVFPAQHNVVSAAPESYGLTRHWQLLWSRVQSHLHSRYARMNKHCCSNKYACH